MPDQRSGPIAITGASGQVGTLLRERLGEGPNELRPLGRGDDWAAAIRGAEAVVHLAGTLQPRRGDSYESANVDTTRTVASAAAAGGAERIVFLSYVGADPESRNAYLRAKGEAEQVLAERGIPTTILRCLHIFGSPEHPGPTASAFLARDSRPVTVPGTGAQRIAPLYVGDVVAAVERAVVNPVAPVGSFELGGPERMSMDDLVRTLNGGEVQIRHLPAPVARIAARLVPSLTPALIDLLVRDNLTSEDPRSAAAELGISLHRLGDVWVNGGS